MSDTARTTETPVLSAATAIRTTTVTRTVSVTSEPDVRTPTSAPLPDDEADQDPHEQHQVTSPLTAMCDGFVASEKYTLLLQLVEMGFGEEEVLEALGECQQTSLELEDVLDWLVQNRDSETISQTAGTDPLTAAQTAGTDPLTVAHTKHDHHQAECVICMDSEPDTIARCGHMCMCWDCANQYKQTANATCPICRQPITELLRVYK